MRAKLSTKTACTLGAVLLLASAAANACTVRVTTWGGSYQATYEKVVKQFEEQENCKVQWVVGASPDHLVKSRLGQVDVATNTLLNSIAGEKEGLWLDLDPEVITNMENLYDNSKYSDQTLFANVGDYFIAYNSNYVDEAPTSWEELWDPEYQQRVIIYGFQHIPTLSLAVMEAEKNGGDVNNIQPGLKRIADLYNDGNLIGALDVESQMVSLLETEDAWLGMLANGRVKELWDKGATHIQVARPQEGTFPLISTINVSKDANDPEMAMKFVNYVLSPEWQTTFALDNLYAPSVKNAEIPEDFEYRDLLVTDEEFERLYLPDQEVISANRSKWREELDKMTIQ